MRYFLIVIMLFTSIWGSAQQRNGQALSPASDAGYRSVAARLPVLKLPAGRKNRVLPPAVNNSKLPYFPGILNQWWTQTCQQVSGVQYAFEYEINRVRNVSPSQQENHYPEKYTFNFLNSGNDLGVSYFSSWDVIKKQGHPAMDVYPADDSLGVLGWMTGYNHYYSAMKNKIRQVYQIPVGTEEGLLTLKNYLYDHLDGSASGGIAVFSATAYTPSILKIPTGSPHEGEHLVHAFHPVDSHGYSIVGYNDSIYYDLNHDGQITNDIDINGDGKIDLKDNEQGAYLIANTLGNEYVDSGFFWVMYRALALNFDSDSLSWTQNYGVWNNSVYVVEAYSEYNPLLTAQVSISHESRMMVSLKAGVSTNPVATIPDHILEFPIWNFQGGDYPVNYLQPPGTVMEAGFDITPLLSFCNPGEPCRLFLITEEKDKECMANGVIHHVSFNNYSGGPGTINVTGENVFIPDNSSLIQYADFTPGFSKVSIIEEELPPYGSLQPYTVQMNAEGGKPPYRWFLMHPYQKSRIDSAFPAITQQEVFAESEYVPKVKLPLPFSFSYYGKTYDTVYMNEFGFICFSNDHLPYRYVVDPGEIIRSFSVISPLMSSFYDGDHYNARMWYDTAPDHVTFRWQTKNFITLEQNFALRLYNDGRFEFLYGECDDVGLNYTGHSGGDDNDYYVKVFFSGNEVQENNLLFTPVNVPPAVSVSEQGLLAVDNASPMTSYDLSVKVIDENSIFSTKNFTLQGQVGIEASLTTGRIVKGIPAPVSIKIKNNLSQEISGLNLKLISQTEGISITDSTEIILSIGQGASVDIPEAFVVFTDSIFYDKKPLFFTITAEDAGTTWTRDASFLFSGPDIKISKPVLNDGVDGLLDPGEVADLLVTVKNEGSVGIDNATITMSTGDTTIRILSSDHVEGVSISSFDTAMMDFLLATSRYSPLGDTVMITLTVSLGEEVLQTNNFPLITGRIGILVMDLTYDSIYANAIVHALDSLGVQSVKATVFPGSTKLYKSLFITLGINSNIHDLEKYRISQALDKGVNIYLESYFMWKQQYHADLLAMFHNSTHTLGQIKPIENVTGIDDTFTEGMYFDYEDQYPSTNYEFLPVNGGYPLFLNSGNEILQSAYDGEDYKTISSLVLFASLTDSTAPSTKLNLMSEYLDFFGFKPEGPFAYFHCDRTSIFKLDSINFYDDSFDNISQWQWTFTGGTPSASAEKNPVVRYQHTGTFDVTLEVTSNAGTNSIKKSGFIHVLPPVGISDELSSQESFIIFPNPADDHFFIRSNTGDKFSFSLFNLHGKIILEKRLQGELNRVDVSLPAGVYIAVLKMKDKSFVEKIAIE